MRIALVSEHASPLAAVGGVDAGGQNVHVAALATELARRGADVVVHTRRDDPTLPRRVALAPGVVVDHVQAGPQAVVSKDELLPFMDAFADDLGRSWAAEPPEIIHSHFWMSGRAALAARPAHVPVVHTFHALGVVKRRHQGLADTSPRGRLNEERGIAAAADRIIATCSDEVVELARMGVDPARVRVVPCGVDLDVFRPTGAAEPRAGALHRIVVIGRLVERKGVDDVIAALAAVPDTELVIAGGPAPADLDGHEEVERLRALAERLDVADRVRLRGQVARSQVPALLRSADAVVCMPWYEPFGIVPLEAMACGVPVVASAVGGMLDTVVDGVTGVHVPPRNPDRLAEVLRSLLGNRRQRAALGAAGRRRAEQCYGWDRVAEATAAAYAEVLRSWSLGEVVTR